MRYFDDHNGSPVQLVAVSDASGDIASVSHNGESSSRSFFSPFCSILYDEISESGSTLKLHTVNAAAVGAIVTSRRIHSICFSNAPEGVSVNVIAGGMDNGVIK